MEKIMDKEGKEEIVFTLASMRGQVFTAEKYADPDVCALGELLLPELRRALRNCAYHGGDKYVPELKRLPLDHYDLKVSCVKKTKDDYSGLILFHPEEDGSLRMFLFFAEGDRAQKERIRIALLHNAEKCLQANYDSETLVRAATAELQGTDFLKKLFSLKPKR